MFHLLVKFMGWSPNQDSLPVDRVFEHTSPDLVEYFKPGGVLNVPGLLNVPTLFVTEIGGKGTQLARIGTITNVSVVSGSVFVQYSLDPRFQPIPNQRLEPLALQLGIESFEFRRTHWAIKQTDLFAELLAAQMGPVHMPKVFSINPEFDQRAVAVMMPFSPLFTEVYSTIQTTARALNLTCNRADDIWKHDAIIQDIVSLISGSAYIICDCTGRNPNVFYEAGIAHTLGREVILITQSESDIPFNLRHLRYVQYLNNAEGRAELARRLTEHLQTIISTPS
jgi:hypothetical protein